MPIPLQSEIIYGPVRTRRLGWSLGLNIMPVTYKLCSFNCVYCQYGWTDVITDDITPQLKDVPAPGEFREALEAALKRSREIDHITFSGNGEATLHPEFAEMVDIARELQKKYFPQARLGILSNSSMVHLEAVRKALAKLDFRIMKLDAGNEQVFRRINVCHAGVDYRALVEGLKKLENVTLQTMFVDGRIQNIGEKEISDWIERVKEIRPIKAQIYSLHRPPAETSLIEVPEEKLKEIARKTERAAGIPVEVVVAASAYRRRYNEPFRN